MGGYMYIVKTAILYQNGEIVIAYGRYNNPNYRSLFSGECIQGFVDECGNFYDRVEAKKVAIEAGQIEDNGEPELYAEDLWPEPLTLGA